MRIIEHKTEIIIVHTIRLTLYRKITLVHSTLKNYNNGTQKYHAELFHIYPPIK